MPDAPVGDPSLVLREIRMEEGRRAFGGDPDNYDAARPPYPGSVFEILKRRCGLAEGVHVFEIGPGTGLATRPLLAAGASPLLAIDPDERLAAALRSRLPETALNVVNTTFEAADLPSAMFDLGVAATSFHWMEQRPALAKVARLLRPGGWWAMWWNVFGDPDEPDPFHDATVALLQGGASPSGHPSWKHPFALDLEARLADLEAENWFDAIDVDFERWTLVLDPAEVRALYATYSQFAPLIATERDRILDKLADIAAREFAGRVERRMVTALYTARRRA